MAAPQDARRATLETREELLRALAVPPGSATVARRSTPSDDILVVRMISPTAVPIERRLKRFHGFDVEYEQVGPVKAGRW